MSWTTFQTECLALTGQEHVSRVQFSQKISQAYHNCVLRHFELLTAGGTVINTAPALAPLYQGLLVTCEQNIHQHNQVNWVQQIGQYILIYWAGAIIVGPTGIVNVTGTGQWTAPPVVQNHDFNIILTILIATARVHLMTLTGIYTSTVTTPPIVTPWSGAMLQTTP